MKSEQAKARHAATLRLRAAELRQRAARIGPWLPSVDLPVHELVEECKRAARALEGAAVQIDPNNHNAAELGGHNEEE